MDNFNKDLAHSIIAHPQFQAAYEELQRESLAALTQRKPEFAPSEVKKILRSALIFAQARDENFAALSQDIVYSLVALCSLSPDELLVCQHIMAMLGNFPASSFIKHPENSNFTLPWQLRLSEEVRRDGNQIHVHGEDILLTDFQSNIWDELNKKQFLSIAAPTSAGKSFLIQTYLRNILVKTRERLDIAYLVPSRSLIHEVQSSLTSTFLKIKDAPTISSVPRIDEPSLSNRSRIFIFTQERLRTAMNEAGFIPDILIVDEAQQIADGSRGMLLLSCLEETHQYGPYSKIVFITPGSISGGPIGSLMGLGELPTVRSSLRPVRQNLIYVDFKSTRKQKHLSLTLHRNDREALPIGTVNLNELPISNSQSRFVAAAVTLGHDSQNLVYAAGKAAAEDLANKIIKITGKPKRPSTKLKELASFVRRHVHHEYSLADCIESEVAFHYGNMPTPLTKAIEDYFSQGEIKYLVCTSTLLQGVNLPARNIFIHNPRKGQGKPMGPEDFWNLAGRAGRLAKDTHGNVFLINYDQWDRKPLEEERQSEVIPSLTRAFTTFHNEVIEYVKDKNHVSGAKETNFAESVFTRLFIDAQEGIIDRTITRATQGKDILSTREIKEAVMEHLNSITLPPEILKKNASVSPLRQQAMFDFLLDAVKRGETKKHIPLHPMHRIGVKERLEHIMSLVHEHLEGKPSRAGKYFAWFSLSWMRGRSLNEMIDFQLKRARTKAEEEGKTPPNAGELIAKVLDDVEKKLRFHYVRYIGCYIDLLKYAIEIRYPGREVDFPAIPLFLELGACSGTMIGCMELGMSRIAAKEITEILGKNDLDAPSIKRRLRRTNFSKSSLSPIIYKEISRLGLISPN